MRETTHRPNTIALTLFLACVLLGSGNFLAVRSSNLELAPLWGAGLRFSSAAAAFLLVALAARRPWPSPTDVRRMAAFGLLGFGVVFAMMYWSLLHVTAGVATIVLATVPLSTLLLAVAQRLERLQARSLLGAGAALLGIGWIAFAPSALEVTLLPLLALVAASVAFGQSIILGKRVSRHFPPVTNTIAMATGGAALLLASRLVGEPWVWPTLPETRWALLYLVTFGSVGLFAMTLLLVRRWSPSATSYAFVVIPLTTMLLESLLSGVPITATAVTGAGLVMMGVWFGALAPRRHTAAPHQRPSQPHRIRATNTGWTSLERPLHEGPPPPRS